MIIEIPILVQCPLPRSDFQGSDYRYLDQGFWTVELMTFRAGQSLFWQGWGLSCPLQDVEQHTHSCDLPKWPQTLPSICGWRGLLEISFGWRPFAEMGCTVFCRALCLQSLSLQLVLLNIAKVIFFKHSFIHFGCAGSSLLFVLFSSCGKQGATLWLWCWGFSLQWLLLLLGMDSRQLLKPRSFSRSFSLCSSRALEHWLNHCGAQA